MLRTKEQARTAVLPRHGVGELIEVDQRAAAEQGVNLDEADRAYLLSSRAQAYK